MVEFEQHEEGSASLNRCIGSVSIDWAKPLLAFCYVVLTLHAPILMGVLLRSSRDFYLMVKPSQIDPRERGVVLKLKEAREKQGVSAASLARKMSLGRNTIPNLERDEARPTLWVLLKMCDGLKLDLSEIVRQAQEEKN